MHARILTQLVRIRQDAPYVGTAKIGDLGGIGLDPVVQRNDMNSLLGTAQTNYEYRGVM